MSDLLEDNKDNILDIIIRAFTEKLSKDIDNWMFSNDRKDIEKYGKLKGSPCYNCLVLPMCKEFCEKIFDYIDKDNKEK